MTESIATFSEPGLWVRLKSDPSRTAITTGNTRKAGPFSLVQIEFGPNEKPYKKKDELELVPKSGESPDELLAKRKWSGADALRRSLALEKIRGQLTDVFYSMESSRTDFFPHQFKPVMKFVESPTGRILIADEVGLGKTIEAVYLWREVEAREHARRLLVLCPSMLREKWQRDMDRLFSLEAEIVDAKSLLERLQRAKSFPDRTRFNLIASFGSARPPRNYLEEATPGPRAEIARLLQEVGSESDEPLLDLVIVDEAHHMRNANTLLYRLGLLLGDASRHLALLTATPIQIGSANLFNLMRLLDQDLFEDLKQFDAMLKANEPIVLAQSAVWSKKRPMLKEAAEHLEMAIGSEYFSDDPTLPELVEQLNSSRELEPMHRVEIGRKLEERSLIAPYMTRSRKREVIENRVVRDAQVLNVDFNDVEKDIYDRITNHLRNQSAGLKGASVFALISRQRQMASSIPAALHAWRESSFLDQLAWEDLGSEFDGLSDIRVDVPKIDSDMARELEEGDSKYQKLRESLDLIFKGEKQEKIIIFAFFRETLKYLQRRLNTDGFETCLIMGDGSRTKTERAEILARFASPDGPSILLSSEVGSEGIDLQFCRVVVNYDLPWNPMRVEQRIGRIDRLGQKAESISILSFAVVNTIEDRILARLYERIAIFRETIGDLEEILGEMSNQLLEKIFNPNLTDEQRMEIANESIMTIVNKRDMQNNLEAQAVNLIGFSDYLMDTINDARELGRWLSPGETISFVEDFFKRNYPGTKLGSAKDVPNSMNIRLSDEAKNALSAFVERNSYARRSKVQTSTRPVLCYFDPRRTEVLPQGSEMIDPMHPMLRWIEGEISSGSDADPALAAISMKAEDAAIQSGMYAFACQRWELRGMRSEIFIAYHARSVSQDSVHDRRQSENLIVAASRKGVKMPHGRIDDADLSKARSEMQTCIDSLNADFGDQIKGFEQENKRRCMQQETSAKRQTERKVGELDARAERMEAENKLRGARLARDQIRKQEEILKMKLDRINRRQKVDIGSSDVACGIILVEA